MANPIDSASVVVGAVSACAYHAGTALVDPFLGLHVDALVVGFAAGVAVQLHIRPKDGKRTPWKVFAYAATASFFAGIFSPLCAGIAIDKIGCLQGMSYEGTRLAAAAAIGVAVFGLPVVKAWAEKKWGGE